MFCTNCGKTIAPDAKFCTHCGAHQTAEPSQPTMAVPASGLPTASPSGSKRAMWTGAVALAVALVGGVGYWGWSNMEASNEDGARKLSDAEQRRIAAERTAEAAEIVVAHELLDKHIAAEEAQAEAAARSKGSASTTLKR
ncbi:MAG: zinc-ribbon domain-containing protein [Candidatus Dechloromonas phosphoritropha]|jgi:uncharacterized protein HemX|nr:zinc-ribbon domain-containing protein [Candidatus Dechloromonas phosphoritropha]MBP8786118.1 zinc-ribbon domain-containing protein [Azonexus sp.]MBP9226837.1 zinc-ribbon domain-containing protein [Azonexus sp.]